MIWIALAVMAAVCWWNTHRYSWYMSNIEKSLREQFARVDRELKEGKNIAEKSSQLQADVRNVGSSLMALKADVKELFDRDRNRAQEVSQAALNEILRR